MSAKREFPLAQVYRLLEPGPVVLVSTTRGGRANIMPMSWHAMMEFVPPLVGCVVSNRNYTFAVLRATGECVINVPTVELARKVVACGNVSGQRIDKFKTFKLTPVAGKVVQCPLIAECYANLECKVTDRNPAGDARQVWYSSLAEAATQSQRGTQNHEPDIRR